jgi:hypothetical protein
MAHVPDREKQALVDASIFPNFSLSLWVFVRLPPRS